MTPSAPPSIHSYTLAQRLSEGGIPAGEALQYATRLAEALRKLHDSGQAHGGLTPAAITITGTGLEIPAAPAPAAEAGPYAAPEVLAGRPANARSDVFSFGAVLYEMLTGRLFGSVGAADESGGTPHAALNPLVDRFLSQCLAADPAARFERMQRVLLELKLLRVAACRREQPVSALRSEMQRIEDRVASRLAEHEKAVSEIGRAAGDALSMLRGEVASVGAQLTAAQERAARAEQSNAAIGECVIGRMERSFESLAQRMERIEQGMDALGQRLAAVEQELESSRQRSAAVEENVAAGFRSCEQTLQAHEAAIESSRSAMVQTDNLVERVVDALDLLQSSVLDRDEEQGRGVN